MDRGRVALDHTLKSAIGDWSAALLGAGGGQEEFRCYSPVVEPTVKRTRKLGFIEYNGELHVHSSLLNIVLVGPKNSKR